MPKKSHLSDAERVAVRDIIDRCGAENVLRAIAGTIANDHPSASNGDEFRRRILVIVKQLASDPAWSYPLSWRARPAR